MSAQAQGARLAVRRGLVVSAFALALAGTSLAQAEAASRLAPTPDSLHRERTAALEQKLTRLLTALPEVDHAELALNLPFPFEESLDAPSAPPAAAVVLVGRPRREDVLRVVQAAVAGLAPEHVTVLVRAPEEPSGAVSPVQVGPFRVHPDSAFALRSWLTISLLANLALAAVVLSRLRRA